jgi:Arc/MetJ-type ribon-helix-helix transcriptional regulator
MPEATAPTDAGIELHLSPSEIELVRAALRLLLSTLGREEADELAEVQALLRKLEAGHAG